MKKIVLLCALLGGCASTGIIPMGKDMYLVSKKSPGGVAVPPSEIKAEILIEANEYCKTLGANIDIINVKEIEARPFVRMSSAELQFMCLHTNDTELTHTRINRD